MKLIPPYVSNSDARGTFTGIINSGQWEELNIVRTGAGQIRGGHYHKSTLELFYMLDGKAEVEILENGGNKQVYSVSAGDIFMIYPLETHTFRCLTQCAWINVLSKKIDPLVPDFYKVAR